MHGENFVSVMSVSDFKSWGAMLRACPICKRPEGNQGGKKRLIKDVVCAFDIETSNLQEQKQNIMYVWHFAYGLNMVVRGRTWAEFKELVEFLAKQLKEKETLAVYVHNLSYEWQYLKSVFNFYEDDVFAINPRKVIKASTYDKKIEFRCSYIQCNMSLALFTSKMGAEHVKLDGEKYNYKKVRYPWTPLSYYEKDYGQNDVIGLVEALKIEMEIDGDNLYTIPMTSTGYVRRDAKKAMKAGVPWDFVKKQQPNFELYKILRKAFRGGDTHANRYYAGCILENVQCVDESSAYPAVMVNCDFPIKPFEKIDDATYDTYIEKCVNRKRPAVFGIRIYDVKLKIKNWGSPYISRDKCQHIDGACYDNGRILRALAIETYVTDVDMSIIDDEYSYSDIEIFDFYISYYGKLPNSYRDLINNYFESKNKLKGVEGAEILYMKSKNLLNSLYGLSAQDPLRIPLIYGVHDVNGEEILEVHEKEGCIEEEEYKKYIQKAFLTYAWGVWVTALARRRLHDGMRVLCDQGAEFIYGDTDSLKYIGDVDWTEYNTHRIKESAINGACASDPSGKKHYMGVFEPDGVYRRFRTWGTKKYVYEDEKGELHITVAGVSKKKGVGELKKAGGLEAFKPGFVFKDAGGVEVLYNDNGCKMKYIEIDGNMVELTSNIYMTDGTYLITDSSYRNNLPEEISDELSKYYNHDINF